MPSSHLSYAKYLSDRHDTLGQLPRIADTPLNEHALEEESNMVARRKLILEAFSNANMDPADGRWSYLANLCRLQATRGRGRWMGTNVNRQASPPARAGRRPPKVRVGADRADLGRKSEGDRVRQKVELWKQSIEQDITTNAALRTTPEAAGHSHPPSSSHQQRGAEESTRLNFKVVKRTAQTRAAKPSKFTRGSSSRPGMESLHSEPSFLPPSFPSHLPTSTPQHPGRKKPPPIPRVSVPSPFISPEKVSVVDSALGLGTSKDQGSSHHPTSSPARNASPSTPARWASLVERPVSVQHSSPASCLDPRSVRRSRSYFSLPNNGYARDGVDIINASLMPHGFSDDDGRADFNPPFTSTQKPATITGHPTPMTDRDVHWKGYNSQFNVDQEAAEISNLLGQDVDIEGWYRKS